MFKLLVIGVIIIGRDPFALFGMQAPGIWEWGQGNKVSFTRTVGVINALTLCCLVELCVRGSCLEVRMMQWVLAWLCFSCSCAYTHLAVFIYTYGISLAHPDLRLVSLGIVLLAFVVPRCTFMPEAQRENDG